MPDQQSASTRMAAEIRQIPGLVAAQLDAARNAVGGAAAAIERAQPRWVSMAARGTSDHAATYGRYLLEAQLGLPVALAAPSLTTIYGAQLDWHDALVIAISQSGRSPDVRAVVEAARASGAVTIAITNDAGSPLAVAAEHVIPCLSGEEQAVAATKTYVAELVALAALVAILRPDSAMTAALPRLTGALEACLEHATRWTAESDAVEAFAGADRALVASRGYNMATALEIALKLKETGAVFAEGYSTADLLHGPIALAGPGIPLLAIRPDGAMGPGMDEGVARALAAGSDAWVVGGRELEAGDHALSLPLDLPEELTPMAFILPGQLLAEAVARARGRDPDAPEGLTKVTLTR